MSDTSPETIEQQLRIEQMTVNIEKMRADMKLEQRKFTLQLVTTMAAVAGVSLALGSFLTALLRH